jgi:hypothetical protein
MEETDNRVAGFEGEDTLPIWSANDIRRPNSIQPGQMTNNFRNFLV